MPWQKKAKVARIFMVPVLLTFLVSASADVRIGSWNVFYKALDDPAGLAAIKHSLNAIDQSGHLDRNSTSGSSTAAFDFFSLIEAAGNTPDSRFSTWTDISAFSGMKSLSGVSGLETIALFYRENIWTPTWWQQSEMEAGRPYILAQFTRTTGAPIWVLAAHLPHYPQTSSVPGSILAKAFKNASTATGDDPRTQSVVMVGDFNEYGECALPAAQEAQEAQEALPKCTAAFYIPAAKGIKPLWDYFGQGKVKDLIAFDTSTCCTKWEEGVADWHHR
jgi:hypothetical protein